MGADSWIQYQAVGEITSSTAWLREGIFSGIIVGEQ
jgi:hypothetical protein